MKLLRTIEKRVKDMTRQYNKIVCNHIKWCSFLFISREIKIKTIPTCNWSMILAEIQKLDTIICWWNCGKTSTLKIWLIWLPNHSAAMEGVWKYLLKYKCIYPFTWYSNLCEFILVMYLHIQKIIYVEVISWSIIIIFSNNCLYKQ